SITAGSPARNAVASTGPSATEYGNAPSLDFFGTTRKTDLHVDIGAVEFSTATVGATASVSPTSLSFGNVGVGSSSTVAEVQTVTLSNSGTTSLTGISLAFTAPFTRSGGTCAGTTLAAGSWCTIGVGFTSAPVGAVNGTLTITASSPVAGSPVSLTLTGVTAQVNPTALDFGNVAVNTNSANQMLTLTNNGTSTLTAINLVVTAPFASNRGTCTTTLAANGSCPIFIRFSPTAAGAVSGTVTITASGTVTGSPVALTGTGFTPAPNASVDPTSLDFGSRPINSNSPNQTLT